MSYCERFRSDRDQATKSISTKEIKIGYNIVGFDSKVISIIKKGWMIFIAFENGKTWKTSDNFETTILI